MDEVKYKQIKALQSLVGLKWEDNNCVELTLKAQELLFGKKLEITEDTSYEDDYIEEESKSIFFCIDKYARKLEEGEEIQPGDIGLARMMGYIHMFTYLSPYQILHIKKDSESNITRINEVFRRRVIANYRIEGGVNKWSLPLSVH